MRELRSSTVSAREKTAESAPPKKRRGRSTKNSATAEAQPNGAETKTDRAWKTRGHIKAAATSKSPEPSEEQEPTEENPVESKEEDVKKETSDAAEGKDAGADKENESMDVAGPAAQADQQRQPSPKARSRTERNVADASLEEEAEEESANESVKSRPGSGKKKKTGAKKPRPVYDREAVSKAADAVMKKESTMKQAAEEFGVSRGVIANRIRTLRGPSKTKKKHHSVGKTEVQVIRVEDLD